MTKPKIKELGDDTAIITIIVVGTSPVLGRITSNDVFWSILVKIADQAHISNVTNEMAYVHIN